MSRRTKKFILAGIMTALIACCIAGVSGFQGDKGTATAAFVPDLDGYAGLGYVKPTIYTMTEIEQMVFGGGSFAPPSSISGNDYKIMITNAHELYTMSYRMDGRPAESYGSLDFRPDIATFFLNKNYILGDFIDYADIDADKEATQKFKQGFMPIGFASYPFTGTFDGQGFTVKNIYFEESATRVTTTAFLGFFAHNNGFVKDVGIIYETERNTNVTNLNSKILVGFAGINEAGGTIDHCYAQATAGGGLIGGAAASGFVYENKGTINGGYFAGSVSGTSAQPLLMLETGSSSGLFYDNALFAGGSSFGTGLVTASMQANFNMTDYPGWYKPNDWGETKYPQRCGLVKIGTTEFNILQPSDLVYFQYLSTTINTAANTIYIAKSLDMTYVSDYAVKTNLSANLVATLTSSIDPLDTLPRVNSDNNCIINLRIHRPARTGAEFHYGLVRMQGAGRVSNIDFIGGSIYIKLGAEIQSATLYAGIVASYYSGSTASTGNILNVNASNDVIFEEEGQGKQYSFTGATTNIGGILGVASNVLTLSDVTYSGEVYGGTHIGNHTAANINANIGGIFGNISGTTATLNNCAVRGTVTGVKFASRQLAGSTNFQSRVGSIGGLFQTTNIEMSGISSTATVNCYSADPLGYKDGAAGYYNTNYSSTDLFSAASNNYSGGLFGVLGGTTVNSSGTNGLSFTGGTLNLYEDYGYVTVDGAESEPAVQSYNHRAFYAGGLFGGGSVSGTAGSIKNLTDCYGTINYVTSEKVYKKVQTFVGIVSGGRQAYSNCTVNQTLEVNSLTMYRLGVSGMGYGGNYTNCQVGATIRLNANLDVPDGEFIIEGTNAPYLAVNAYSSAFGDTTHLTNSISTATLEYGSDDYNTVFSGGARLYMSGAGYTVNNVNGFESDCTMTLKNVVLEGGSRLYASGCATYRVAAAAGNVATNIVNKTDLDFSDGLVTNASNATYNYMYLAGVAYEVVGTLSNSVNEGNIRYVSGTSLRSSIYMGGVVYILSGTVRECANFGNITADVNYFASNTINLGGVGASINSATAQVINVYNKGNISFANAGTAVSPSIGGINGTGLVPIANALNEGNITVEKAAISNLYMGGIIGDVGSSAVYIEFSNLINRGRLTFDNGNGTARIGGIAGRVSNAAGGNTRTFINSVNDGEINIASAATVYAGGIVGQIVTGDGDRNFFNTVSSGIINVAASGTTYAGGIIGLSESSAATFAVYSAINYCRIMDTGSGTNRYLGGFVGYENASASGRMILDGFANYGSISGGQFVGGVSGYFKGGNYRNIVNYGALSGTNIGAFAGRDIADAAKTPSLTNFIHIQSNSGSPVEKIIGATSVSGCLFTDVYSTTTFSDYAASDYVKTNSADEGGIYHEDFKLRLEGNLTGRLNFSVHGYVGGYKTGANLISSGVVGGGRYIYAVVSSNQYLTPEENRQYGYYLTVGMDGMVNGIPSSMLSAAEKSAISGYISDLRQLIGVYETEIIDFTMDVDYGEIFYGMVEADLFTTSYQGDPHMEADEKFIREPNDIKIYLDAENIQENYGNLYPYYFTVTPASFIRTYNSGFEYRDANNALVVDSLSFEIINLNLQQVDVLIGYIRVYQNLPGTSDYGEQYKDWAVYVSYIPEIKGLSIQSIIYDSDSANQEQLSKGYTTLRDAGDYINPAATPTAAVVTANTVDKTSETDDFNSSMDWRAGRLRINLFSYGLSTGIDYKSSLRVYKVDDFSMIGADGAIDMSGYEEVSFSADRSNQLNNTLFYTNRANNGIVHNVALVTEGDEVFTRGTLFFELEFNDRLAGGCYIVQVADPDGLFTLTVGVIKIFADEFNYLRYGVAAEYGMYYHTQPTGAANTGLADSAAAAYTNLNNDNTLNFAMRYRAYPQLGLLETGNSFSSILKQSSWYTVDAVIQKAYKIEIEVVDNIVEFYPTEAELAEEDYSVIQKLTRTVSTHKITVYFRVEYGRKINADGEELEPEEWTAVFSEAKPVDALVTVSQAGIAFDKVDEIRSIKVQRSAASGNGNIITTYATATNDYYSSDDLDIESYKDGEPIFANGSDNMPNAMMTGTRAMTLEFVSETIGGYYGFHPYIKDVDVSMNTIFSEIEVVLLDAEQRGAFIEADGTLTMIGMKYYLTPIFVEKTVNNDSYIKNVIFETTPKPATAELYKVVAEGTPVGRVDINDGQVIYTNVNTDYKDPDRDDDLLVYARYSSDEATLSSYISFVIPELSTLWELQYDGDQWDWVKIYWSVEEDGEIKYYGNPRVLVYEGSNVKFKCIAENTNYETEYSITLATLIPVQYVDVIINVPADYEGQVFASLYTMLETEGVFNITRATNIIYSKNAAVAVTIDGKDYMRHTVNLAKHILTYFQIAVTTIQGYVYYVESDQNVDPTTYSPALEAASNGRPIILLSEFNPAARIVEITIAEVPFDSWGYYYNSSANPISWGYYYNSPANPNGQ